MSRIQNKKRACIVAASAILLCLVSLTGATLALFTNNPDDSTIGIVATAGDIEVKIVDLAGDSLEGKALAFQTTAQQENNLEPGATVKTQEFRIVNAGGIPLRYSISVCKEIKEHKTENDTGENVDINEFAKSFDVWIWTVNEDGSNPQPVTDLLQSKTFSDKLEIGQSSQRFYLVVKMKETVGNEFQNKTYSGIGVTVYAVQGNGQLPNENTETTAAPTDATNEG